MRPFLLFASCLFLIAFHTDFSFSQPVSAERFKIVVRAVGGEGERIEDPSFEPTVNDSRIEDLRIKLKRFPFSSYHLIATNEVLVDLMKRGKVQLSNGHTLCLRPLTSEGDQMTLWMKWDGEDDMSILNTRLNFAINEPMIVGYEGQDSTGLILAVQVVPQ